MGGEDTNTESTGKSAKSYGAPGRFNHGGHGSKGKLVLGKLEELGELVYKVNTKDQADMYIRTTEAIGDYVAVEYGWNMRLLVNQGKEAEFTKPKAPTAVMTRAAMKEEGVGLVDSVKMAEYKKAELDLYHKDMREYQSNKEKVFVVILGQCTKGMKSALAKSKLLTIGHWGEFYPSKLAKGSSQTE
jgi:hypothetical protein